MATPSIQYITHLLEEPEAISDTDRDNIQSLTQVFPYFLPMRYAHAALQQKQRAFNAPMMTEMQLYMGNWLLFADYVGRATSVTAEDKERVVPKIAIKKTETISPFPLYDEEFTKDTGLFPKDKGEDSFIPKDSIQEDLPVSVHVTYQDEAHPAEPMHYTVTDTNDVRHKEQDMTGFDAFEPAEVDFYEDEVEEMQGAVTDEFPREMEALDAVTHEAAKSDSEVVAFYEEVSLNIHDEEQAGDSSEIEDDSDDEEDFGAAVSETYPEFSYESERQHTREETVHEHAAHTIAEKNSDTINVDGLIDDENTEQEEDMADSENEELKSEEPLMEYNNSVNEEEPYDNTRYIIEQISIPGAPKDEGEPMTATTEDKTEQKEEILITPIYTDDYFLHQGIDVSSEIPEDIDMAGKSKEEAGEDKSLMVVMSFTEWLMHFKTASEKEKEEREDKKALKTMWQKEKLAAAIEEGNDEIPEQVFEMAVNSIAKEENLVSEALAEIYEKQGKYDTAIDMYHKLSLRNPQKNAYFARKIEALLKAKEL